MESSLSSEAMKQINMLKARPDLPFPYKIMTPFRFLIFSVKGHPITGHEGPTGGVEV
jgi:hypothetical protein